ncbi:heme exporter protein CcmD [Gammaproteobacteria bacterium AH-315-C21]|nr:heme exporter protein CcmD [Gammaproteobacteria bacterium AH-315-C21]
MTELFDMGKHTWFVWGSYAVFFIFIVAELVLLGRRRRTIWQRLSRIKRMNSGDNNET